MSKQKKKQVQLAVAVAALALGGTSHAQWDHTVYGVADLSYGRFEPSGQLPSHRFNSNSLTASFAGVSGTYLLDSGWNLGVRLEAFVRFQDGALGRSANDPKLSRKALLSASHRTWGTVRGGRNQSLLFETAVRFNAFENSVAFSPAIRQVFAAGNLMGVQGDFYWNNSVSYTLPELPEVEGLSGSMMYAQGEQHRKGDLYGLSVIFARGLWAASVSAQTVRTPDLIAGLTRERAWQVAASRDFSLGRVYAMHTEIRDAGLLVDSRSTSVGAAVPIGPGKAVAQWASGRAWGQAVDRRQATFSLGYVYEWDSVTHLYGLFMDDRIRGQTRGLSGAIGVRYQF